MSAPAEVVSLSPLHPSLVLSAYAADLVVGARIALFGDATLSLTSELVERGARLVHVFDIDAVRVAEAGARASRRSVIFGTLPPHGEELGPSGPAFDLVFIPDLSFTKDPNPLLRTARRILSPSGTALVASPNPDVLGGDALGYYELYDAVAANFRRVRMVGQAPFVGYVLAELAAEEEPSVSIDTSLAGRPEPEWFVALAGDRPVRFEPYAIVELPYERQLARDKTVFERFATIPAPPPVLPEPSRMALDAARAEAEARTATALAERKRALADFERAIAERDSSRAREKELQKELAEERERASHLQTTLASKAAELASQTGELERLRTERMTLSALVATERSGREGLEREVEELRRSPEIVGLRERVEVLEEARARLEADAEQYEAEIVAFEARLRERGRVGEELRREVSRRAGLVRELVSLMEPTEESFVEEAEPPQPEGAPEEAAAPVEVIEPALAPESAAVPTAVAPEVSVARGTEELPIDALADLQNKLDRLAGEAARREADLMAASWKIAELERRLERRARKEP